ncbi:hypothetical protein RIF29_28876 [Crotalaria pallida]|uniref:Uncharacterized protein n=1 Tax=Crotalaria pallida TaxID=3830 RepID=A0AAN9EFV6_CROPI
MPKKRGRPQKNTPQSSSKQHDKPARDTFEPQTFDISQIDEEDLVEIDNLSPKQAEVWLKNLDVLRDRIKGKSAIVETNMEKPMENIPSLAAMNPSIKSQPKTAEPAKPNDFFRSASEVVKELSQGNLVTDDVIGASKTPTGADPDAISGLNNVAAKEADAGKHDASYVGPNSLESITPEEGEWTQDVVRFYTGYLYKTIIACKMKECRTLYIE